MSLEGVVQKQVGEVQHLQDIFAVLATWDLSWTFMPFAFEMAEIGLTSK